MAKNAGQKICTKIAKQLQMWYNGITTKHMIHKQDELEVVKSIADAAKNAVDALDVNDNGPQDELEAAKNAFDVIDDIVLPAAESLRGFLTGFSFEPLLENLTVLGAAIVTKQTHEFNKAFKSTFWSWFRRAIGFSRLTFPLKACYNY